MRRTLLNQCKDCKYCVPEDYCVNTPCYKCELHTETTLVGRNEKGEFDETGTTNCLCLCDATDEELSTKTCKYKEVVK